MESVWRCFVALPVPAGIARRLADRLAPVRADNAGVRWLGGEQLHVTLAFLGAMPVGNLAALEAALVAAAGASRPFTLGLTGAGSFGGRGRQPVAWLGVGDGRAACVDLAGRVLTACRAVGAIPAPGDATDDPVFRPHVTVARRATPGLTTFIAGAVGPRPLAWQADAIVLYRSHLGPPIVRYERLARFPLGGDLLQSGGRG